MRRAGTAGLTKLDLAKYPFLRAASAYVAEMHLDIKDLTSPSLSGILDRAIKRVSEAIRAGEVSTSIVDEDLEVLSYPVAIALVAAVGNDYLEKRYALAEAKRAEHFLLAEPADKLLAIARELGWHLRRIEVLDGGILYEFSVSVLDYLRNASGLKGPKWKLVNRLVRSGEVLLTSQELARLLTEEIRRRIEASLEKATKGARELPEALRPYVEKVRELLKELRLGEGPSLEAVGEVRFEAFPPCMKAIYEALSERRHVPHAGRFAFTAFLIHIGMSVDDIVELFRRVADFSEKITRYQVEHIAGERGSKTRYTPPSCRTMRSYGLCVGADELCEKVNHPLSYYRRKLWALRRARKEAKGEEGGEGESGREDS